MISEENWNLFLKLYDCVEGANIQMQNIPSSIPVEFSPEMNSEIVNARTSLRHLDSMCERFHGKYLNEIEGYD